MADYDFIAIGGGSAGLTASAAIAEKGLHTAVVDIGPIGGLCALNGCNPKKVLVRTEEVLEELRHAKKFGLNLSRINVHWSRVIARKRTFTGGVTEWAEKSLKKKGIQLLTGPVHFVSRDELMVGNRALKAKGILIATGSKPRPLLFPGAHFLKISDDLLDLRTIPNRLVILGAGTVAFELGHVYARLGTHVTLLTPGENALPGSEIELARRLVEFSKSLGMKFIFKTNVESVSKKKNVLGLDYTVSGKANAIQADCVLNAAGRVPSIAELSLERAGVKATEKGVAVNEFLRSPANRLVFAAGDAHGRMQHSPVAAYEGEIVAKNFLEQDTESVNYDAIPTVVFTVPPFASVGLTEAQAKERGYSISAKTFNLKDWMVYKIAGESFAFAKIVVDSKTGEILGAHLLGNNAPENIHLFSMAIKFKLKAYELQRMVFAYPTMASTVPDLLAEILQ